MQNYSVGYPTYSQVQTPYAPVQQQYPVGSVQTQTVMPAVQAPQNASGTTFNIGVPQAGVPANPNAANLNGASGVTINILGAGVYPNGANINNTYNNTGAGMNYPPNYYLNNMAQPVSAVQPTYGMQPTVPIASTPINQESAEKKPQKDIVLLTDEYIKTLENYIRNDNPEIKLMGAKELLKRFKEHESRKNDPALTALLNLTLQSKYSPVKMVGMNIIDNGWAQGDRFTQQLLSQIQQSKSGYGLDALDAASAALKSAGKTIKVDDPNPPKTKSKNK